MAHKGEVQAIITTVIPLPAEEEKELKETLQEIIGQGKKVKLEQKVDPSILGGLVVEFERKVFDMSIRTRAKQMERWHMLVSERYTPFSSRIRDLVTCGMHMNGFQVICDMKSKLRDKTP
ncbi:ATP synthase subunit O, mitochondrial-like protein [Drosera capensis]